MSQQETGRHVAVHLALRTTRMIPCACNQTDATRFGDGTCRENDSSSPS